MARMNGDQVAKLLMETFSSSSHSSYSMSAWLLGKLSFCWGITMPLMLCRYTSTLVLISSTWEGLQAESTPPGVNSVANGAQTQDPKISSQPPEPLSQHQASHKLN